MKKYFILFMGLFFVASIAYGFHVHGSGIADGGGPTYLHRFLLEQAYETTKVRDEVDSGNIGTITGTVSFESSCGANGPDFDASGEYIVFTGAELDQLSDLNHAKIRWTYTWDGTTSIQGYSWYQWSGGDGPRIAWQPSDGRWAFLLYENSVAVMDVHITDADPSSGTCYYYELEYNYNNTLTTFTMSHSTTGFDNMTVSSTTENTMDEGTGTVSVSNFMISSNYTNRHSYGSIGEFAFIQP